MAQRTDAANRPHDDFGRSVASRDREVSGEAARLSDGVNQLTLTQMRGMIPADELVRYDQVLGGGCGKQLFDEMLAEPKHRRSMEARAPIYLIIIVGMFLVAALFTAHDGHGNVALGIVGIDMGAVVAILYTTLRSQR